MTAKKGIITALVVAALGTGGFFVGHLFLSGGGTTAQRPNVVDELSAAKTREAQLQAEPRFNGELLGIYIAPSLDQLPQAIQEENSRLNADGCRSTPVEQASALDFAHPLALIPRYVLSDQDPANTGSNPGALACGGGLFSLGWGYTTAGTNGAPATISIVRTVINYDIQDVAQSQVATQTVGGRDAVVIRPASSTGLAQRYLIYFPETFGMTSIQTFNLPETDALGVARAVAEASR